jgi:putative acetyltransferase
MDTAQLRASDGQTEVSIRPELPGDRAGIRAVEEAAFERKGEADLVDALRQAGALTVSLVAVQGGQVVGHIAFSPIDIADKDNVSTALCLAPIAVLPACQRESIGAALVQAGLEACRAAGATVVVVLGHPTYYPRFGFQPAMPLGIEPPFAVPSEAFMVAELTPGGLAGHKGTVRYRPEFALV